MLSSGGMCLCSLYNDGKKFLLVGRDDLINVQYTGMLKCTLLSKLYFSVKFLISVSLIVTVTLSQDRERKGVKVN